MTQCIMGYPIVNTIASVERIVAHGKQAIIKVAGAVYNVFNISGEVFCSVPIAYILKVNS